MAALQPWREAGGLLDQVRGEMDDLFRRFFGGPDGNGGLTPWSPRVDVEETDVAVVVRADLPGIDPKDIEVAVRDGVLTVCGHRQEQREEKGKNFLRTERSVGQFYRAIPLPAGVNEEGVTAATSKGVVTITVPKKPGSLPRKIPVKAEG